MRASLASASSLLALLLLDARSALAVATNGGLTTQTLGFGNVLVNGGPLYGIASMSDTATVTNGAGATTVLFATATNPFGGGGQTATIASNTTATLTGTYTFAPTLTGAAAPQVMQTTLDGVSVPQGLITLTGTGVAPVANGPVSAATFSNYVLVGQTSAPVTLNVSNTGNGNLAGTGAAYNLNGSINSGNSVFVGTGSFSLTDNSKGTVLSTSSQSFGFTFKPTITGTQTATVTTTFDSGFGSANKAGSVATTLTGTAVAPVQLVTPNSAGYLARVGSTVNNTVAVANVGNGNLAGTGTAYNLNGSVTNALGAGFSTTASGTISLASNATATTASTASTTLGYTYSPVSRGIATTTVTIAFSNGSSGSTVGQNLSQSVVSTLTGTGVGPVYAGSIKGGAVSTPTAGANGAVIAASKTIQFGSVGYKNSQTVYLDLQNTSTDANGGVASLTNLSILKYSIAGGATSAFSVPTGLGGVLAENGAGFIEIPITVIGNSTIGSLNDSLTIFTDESVGFGGAGDTFTYALTAFSVPEPASLVALGAGLTGLASIRRRRVAVQPA